jgi:hypothetical protein
MQEKPCEIIEISDDDHKQSRTDLQKKFKVNSDKT